MATTKAMHHTLIEIIHKLLLKIFRIVQDGSDSLPFGELNG